MTTKAKAKKWQPPTEEEWRVARAIERRLSETLSAAQAYFDTFEPTDYAQAAMAERVRAALHDHPEETGQPIRAVKGSATQDVFDFA